MGDWVSIIVLVLVGLVLIYLELIFIPGTTILGILGLILTGVGIYMAFDKFGDSVGYAVLMGSIVVSIVALVYSFKSRSWERFALKQKNTGKVNEAYASDLQVEMRGIALSDLRPIGKGEFRDKSYEVTSHGDMIEAGEQIRIIKIERNRIVVESTN